MNTRLQVEHPVTEAVTGLDLVEWQFRVAAGEPLPLQQQAIARTGAAIEARIYAEDPEHNFLPSPGLILAMSLGEEAGQGGVRVDTGVEGGDSVTPFYDAMIAKLIVHAPTRAEALAALNRALDRAVVVGPKTNLAFLRALMRSPEVAAGAFDTGFIDQRLASLGATPHPPDERAVLAAARTLLDKRDAARPSPASPFDPWGIADSFELMGPRHVGLDVLIDSKPTRLHVVEESGHALEASQRSALASEGSPPPTLFETVEGVYAFADGRQAYVQLIDPLERSAGGADEGDGGVRAPMNGRVAALFVVEGETVEAGQRLAVVEAMKMEHALTAPFAGVIRDLVSAVGEQVDMGERIMQVEPAPG